MSPRLPGHLTPVGKRWFVKIQAVQGLVRDAEEARDRTVHRALDQGLGIRGVAEALGIDKTTAQRRYGGRTKEEQD